jgi:hypothetical protein
MNTTCSMISVMVRSVPHVKWFCVRFDCLYRDGYSRLARLYVRLWPGQLFIFCASGDEYSGTVKYPAYDAFVANVKLEAVQNVQRLRHHPSIVILAGNNEGLAPFSQSLKINGT